MILYCLRHGQAEHNPEHIMNDDPTKSIHLTELGKQQVQKASDELKDKKIEVIFASEFPRAQETAKIINKYHNVEIKIDKRLNDIISGFEGKNSREWADFISSDGLNKKKEGAESVKEVVNRVYQFLNDLKKRPEKEAVIISHGVTTEAIRTYFGDTNIEENPTKAAPNAKVFEFELE